MLAPDAPKPVPVENGNDALRRLAVPQVGTAARLALAAQYFTRFCNNAYRVGSGQDIAALVNGDGALGVVAHGDARHAQRGGFFLQAAAVSQNQRGVLPQIKESHVSLRPEQRNAGAEIDLEPGQIGAGARMHRKDQRQFAGDLL